MAQPRPRLAILAAVLLASCAAPRPQQRLEPGWQSLLHRDHPLVGRVWDVQAGRFAAPDELLAAVARRRFLLLGETHDNPDHHALEARLLRAAVAGGRRPALAFEMLDVGQQGAVDAVLRAPAPGAEALRQAVGWDHGGWPAFVLYQPIFQTGLDARLPILAANLSRQTARAVIHEGAGVLDAPVRALLEKAGPLPAGEERERREEMEALHCGQLPEPFLGPMVLAQRARDAQLAHAVASGATRDGAVLVTGAEHARRDRGAGRFLEVSGVPRGEILAVAFREVDPGATAPADHAPAPYDFVVFTPAWERGDPCEGMRSAPAARRLP